MSGNLPTRVAPDPDVSRLLATNYRRARKFRLIYFVTVKDPRHFFKHVWPVRVWAKCFLCTWKIFKTLKQFHWSRVSARRRRSSFLATSSHCLFPPISFARKKTFFEIKTLVEIKTSVFPPSTSNQRAFGRHRAKALCAARTRFTPITTRNSLTVLGFDENSKFDL